MNRRWWVRLGGGTTAVLTVAVGVATNQVLNNGRLSWPWLTSALVIAVLTVVLDRSLAMAERREESEREARQDQGEAERRRSRVTRLTAGSVDGELRRLGEVDIEVLGVRIPRESSRRQRPQLPYATRQQLDPRIDKALVEHRFVLVHGPSAAGKSRSTAEIARRLFGNRPVLVPLQTPDALTDVVETGLDLNGAVVWLDDLDRHLSAGVHVGLIRRLLEVPELRIVATIRAAAYEQYKSQGEFRSPGRDVIELAELVEFDDWDDVDREHAGVLLVDQPDVVTALAKGLGLGEYLSAGPDLVDRLESGSPPPDGAAVVRAAVDWYRAGLNRPAPLEFVCAIYQHYLPDDDATLLDRFDNGLVWASEPVSGVRMLTRRTDGAGLVAHDYVLDHLASTLPAGLPKPAWDAIAAALHGKTEEIFAVSVTARLTHHDPVTAERFSRLAAEAGHVLAMTNLGIHLQDREDSANAERWWRAAAAAGDAQAMHNLGQLFRQERGDLAAAEPWYRAAAEAGHTPAMYNLAGLLRLRGKIKEEWRWLRRAAAAGDTGAMHNMAVQLRDQDRFAEAKQWFLAGIKAGDANAAFNIGMLVSGGRQSRPPWCNVHPRDLAERPC